MTELATNGDQCCLACHCSQIWKFEVGTTVSTVWVKSQNLGHRTSTIFVLSKGDHTSHQLQGINVIWPIWPDYSCTAESNPPRWECTGHVVIIFLRRWCVTVYLLFFFWIGNREGHTTTHIHTYHLESIATSQVWATERFQMMLTQSREQHPTPRILTRVLQPLLPHLRRKHHQEVEVPFPWTL